MNDVYKGMPKLVRVGCFQFKIEIGDFEDHEAETSFGHCNVLSQKIRLRPGMSGQNLANTFIHEVLHAIHWFHDLKDADTEEDFTTRGANGLVAFWQDNPKAIGWWTRTLLLKDKEPS